MIVIADLLYETISNYAIPHNSVMYPTITFKYAYFGHIDLE